MIKIPLTRRQRGVVTEVARFFQYIGSIEAIGDPGQESNLSMEAGRLAAIAQMSEAIEQGKGLSFGGTDVGGGGALIPGLIEALDAAHLKYADLGGAANIIGVGPESLQKISNWMGRHSFEQAA